MCCTVTGQGAGVAAAVSLKDGVIRKDVKISRKQEDLIEQGGRVE